MPPISYMQLLKKKQQGVGLYDPKNARTVAAFQKALRNTIQTLNKEGKGRVNTRKLQEFDDKLFIVMKRDPSTMEEYTEKERQEKLWHPERPQRPRQHVNRNSIENAVCSLSELGDFLGKEAPGEYTNTYDCIQQYADPYDAEIIRKGLELVNDTFELGIPLEKLATGTTYSSTNEEKKAWKEYKAAVKEGQENRKANLKDFEAQKSLEEQKRQQASREADAREAREIEEKSRQQLAEERKRIEEEKRRQEEARKSAEQKKQEEEARREKTRQTNLSNQEAMRMGMTQSTLQYRDPDAAAETKKMNMAMAAAFHAELERVGPDGTVPIDADRVKRDIDAYFHSAEFAIAEAEGRLNSLTILNPEQLRTRITEREREVQRDHPEAKETDVQRAKKLWQKMNGSWRVAKNSREFEAARDAMKAVSDKKRPATRAENYLAAETVKRYVAKNINKAKSDAGKNRMSISLAFLKQTMTPASFQAYCNALNVQRQAEIPHTIGENGIEFDRTSDRYINPREIGTVDEVYNETKERIAAVKDGKKPDARDLAMLTALSELKKRGSGDQAVEKSALEAEIKKVQQDPRFRSAIEKDSAEDLINKAWYGSLNKLEGYAQPAPKAPTAQVAAQQDAPQVS